MGAVELVAFEDVTVDERGMRMAVMEVAVMEAAAVVMALLALMSLSASSWAPE